MVKRIKTGGEAMTTKTDDDVLVIKVTATGDDDVLFKAAAEKRFHFCPVYPTAKP